MVKVVSYRQKLIELARIYKIDKVFDQNLKHTTYEIEIILLKNKVPLPSRRGYIPHVLINEVLNPFFDSLEKIFSMISEVNKYFINPYKRLIKKLFIIFNPSKIFSILNPSKYLKKIFISINKYFKFIILNINNFFKTLFKTIVETIIETLNNIYNFKVRDEIVKSIFVKGMYASLITAVIFSGFYIKELIVDVNSLKKTLEVNPERQIDGSKLKNKEFVKIPNIIKKNDPKDSTTVKKDKESSSSIGDYKLNTQTVLNLFEDLEYDLDKVRNKKKVKPIYFTRLPKDLDTIKNVKEKKETFLQILLPLVVAENEKIKKDREYLLEIWKDNESEESKKWLNKKYKTYKVSDRNISELIEKIDIIPTSIALAQAAKESGWGTSRFALEGNAIYGQWTWNGDGIEPLEKAKNQNHKILKFPLLRASVKAYITNLNTHRGYKGFRAKRAELRKKNQKLTGIELIHQLDNYAQNGKEYTRILEQIIKQNDLDELESVTIDDFKKSNQLKL